VISLNDLLINKGILLKKSEFGAREIEGEKKKKR